MKYIKLSDDLTKEAMEIFFMNQAVNNIIREILEISKDYAIKTSDVWQKIHKELKEKGINVEQLGNKGIRFNHRLKEVEIDEE